jgi:N-acetylglucosamine-6-phosphate deacetylase
MKVRIIVAHDCRTYRKRRNVLAGLRGFVDLHTHGLGRYDTRTGRPEDILHLARLHAERGTGAILATVYPGPIVEMRSNLEAVRIAMSLQMRSAVSPQHSEFKRTMSKKPEIDPALILGANLEGPFISPESCGALNGNFFLKPSLAHLKKMIAGYEDIIRIITIAPEMPGALKVIGKCAELGIKVNMGHSSATFRQALEGKKAGATGITHLFNAMRSFHHREPGLAGLGLIDGELFIEVIADGIHLHPGTLELIFSTKSPERIILVSDSVKGRKTGKGAVYSRRGVLAGSATGISGAVRKLKSLGIPDAVIRKTSSDNPAQYLGLKITQ